MAKVHLVSVYEGQPYEPNLHYALEDIKKSATLDSLGVHTVTTDADEADIILFVEMGTTGMFAEPVRSHQLYRRYPEKCFLYDWGDDFWPVLPGIYASLQKRYFAADHTRTGFYVLPENPYIQYRPVTGQEEYLASFVGSFNTHPLRMDFLKYQRDDIYIQDTSKESYRTRYHGTPEEKDAFWRRYADSIGNASFSLCPRGRGPGSIRLYESMKMGRACVILADEWVPNDFVDWNSFSIRLSEADVVSVPDVLDQFHSKAAEMGARARQEWERWFSEPVRFHHLTELCFTMLNQRKTHGLLRRLPHYRHIVNPGNWRMYFRSKAILYRRTKKLYW